MDDPFQLIIIEWMFVERQFSLNVGGNPLAYESTKGFNTFLFLNHKILHSCPLTYVARIVSPPTFQVILILPIHICVHESSLHKQLNGIQTFAIVVYTRVGKHLHMLLLHYPPPLYNVMLLQFQKTHL